ncbi:hypothetical protein RFI_16014, partial [Reticulomyxa filosa]
EAVTNKLGTTFPQVSPNMSRGYGTRETSPSPSLNQDGLTAMSSFPQQHSSLSEHVWTSTSSLSAKSYPNRSSHHKDGSDLSSSARPNGQTTTSGRDPKNPFAPYWTGTSNTNIISNSMHDTTSSRNTASQESDKRSYSSHVSATDVATVPAVSTLQSQQLTTAMSPPPTRTIHSILSESPGGGGSHMATSSMMSLRPMSQSFSVMQDPSQVRSGPTSGPPLSLPISVPLSSRVSGRSMPSNLRVHISDPSHISVSATMMSDPITGHRSQNQSESIITIVIDTPQDTSPTHTFDLIEGTISPQRPSLLQQPQPQSQSQSQLQLQLQSQSQSQLQLQSQLQPQPQPQLQSQRPFPLVESSIGNIVDGADRRSSPKAPFSFLIGRNTIGTSNMNINTNINTNANAHANTTTIKTIGEMVSSPLPMDTKIFPTSEFVPRSLPPFYSNHNNINPTRQPH